MRLIINNYNYSRYISIPDRQHYGGKIQAKFETFQLYKNGIWLLQPKIPNIN